MRLVTSEQMREMDRRAIEELGLPEMLLMERAALGAVDFLSELLPAPSPEYLAPRVVFLCGAGNNAGDAFAMARIILARGFRPELVLLAPPKSLKGAAKLNLEIAKKLDIPLSDLSADKPATIQKSLENIHAARGELTQAAAWCDALLGTGLDRPLDGRFLSAVQFLNRLSKTRAATVFSVDIPSGLHANSGQLMGEATRAHATASFGYAKLGQSLYPGRARCGELRVIDIGIPAKIAESTGFAGDWLDKNWAQEKLGSRPATFHKGDSGRVLLLAGSEEQTGAAILAASGALRAGAGLITVGTHEPVVERIALALPEAMSAPMLAHTAHGGYEERLRSSAERLDVAAIGPGIGTSDGTMQQLLVLLDSELPRLVIDADAITVLAKLPNYEKIRAFSAQNPDDPRAVLTPHPLEMARICQCAIGDIEREPVKKALELARNTGAIVVLKTATTIVAAPDGKLAINRSGNPGMASGGTGDVLTGVIAGLLAEDATRVRPNTVFERVCLAVWAHGRAGDLAKKELGERGVAASDLPRKLGQAFRELGR